MRQRMQITNRILEIARQLDNDADAEVLGEAAEILEELVDRVRDLHKEVDVLCTERDSFKLAYEDCETLCREHAVLDRMNYEEVLELRRGLGL